MEVWGYTLPLVTDVLWIIAPIENTPADRVGLKPLDEIVKVDEKNVIGMTSDEVVKLFERSRRKVGKDRCQA